jgi:hypothetical protein
MPPPPLLPESLIQQSIEAEFQCERCGNCCKGDGAVRIDRDEADRIARFLGLAPREFLKTYATHVGGGYYWLQDRADRQGRWCVFLDRDPDGLYRCKINPVKPEQCRSFPAKWRNEDSFRSCAGLKTLMRTLRARARPTADSAPPLDAGAAPA